MLQDTIEDVLISAALAAFARGEHVEVCRAVIRALPPERRLALWPERRRYRNFFEPADFNSSKRVVRR